MPHGAGSPVASDEEREHPRNARGRVVAVRVVVDEERRTVPARNRHFPPQDAERSE
jgi:hypothetical protein